ncbi:MAG: hypothetical protein HC888_02490 [Candidatus Competibacteraceae bacterium]|nr:hypothetical protein [Candidatus Competibacteraceae bacterium]
MSKNFGEWLQSQSGRKDAVGWYSRLLFSQVENKDRFSFKQASQVIEQFESMPQGKPRSSLIEAYRQWVKEAAREPMVGIWWELHGQLIDYAIPVREAQAVTGFKDSPFDHATKWYEVQRLYPGLQREEYFDIPRGRIIQLPTGNFRSFVPPERLNDANLHKLIRSTFNIAPQIYEPFGDEHYAMNAFGDDEFFRDFGDDDVMPDDDMDGPNARGVRS